MKIYSPLQELSDNNLKKLGIVTGVAALILYLSIQVVLSLGKIDVREYSDAWFSFKAEMLTGYYRAMIADGRFVYYVVGNCIDLFFVFSYVPLFLYFTERARRGVSPNSRLGIVCNVFSPLIIAVGIFDLCETGTLLVTAALYPNIPGLIMTVSAVTKIGELAICYPVIAWLLFLLVRNIFRRMKKRRYV